MLSGVKALIFGGLAVPAIVVAAACSPTQASTPREVALTATNYQYTPKEVTLKAGETVKLVVTNSSNAKHNFHIDGQKIDVNIDPGQNKTIEWKAPDKAGSVNFGCEDNEKQGMTGKFQIQ